MYESRDGGKTWNCEFFRGVFGDYRSIWWDEQDPFRIMLGSDGGVNVSYDGGRTGDYFLNKRRRRGVRGRRGHGRSHTTSTAAFRITIRGKARAIRVAA